MNTWRQNYRLCLLWVFVLLLVWTCGEAEAQVEKPVVLGYYGYWDIYPATGYTVDNIPLNKLTHINYAFIGLESKENPDKTIGYTGNLKSLDETADFKYVYAAKDGLPATTGNIKRLADYRDYKYNDLKLFLSIGGDTLGWPPFQEIAKDPTKRNLFAQSCAYWVSGQQEGFGKKKFDGIDIDWEFPVGQEDKANFTALLQAVRTEFDKQGQKDGKKYALTIAVGVGLEKIQSIDLKEVSKIVDYISLMTYDYAVSDTRLKGTGIDYDEKTKTWRIPPVYITGLNAPLFEDPNYPIWDPNIFNAAYAVDKYIKEGAPASKLILGLPLYGKSWVNVDKESYTKTFPTSQGPKQLPKTEGGLFQTSFDPATIFYKEAPTYATIMQLAIDPTYRRYLDEAARVPYLFSSDNNFISYDDKASVGEKLKYLQENGLGGAMLWELSQDIRNADDPQSLVNFVYNGLNSKDLIVGNTAGTTEEYVFNEGQTIWSFNAIGGNVGAGKFIQDCASTHNVVYKLILGNKTGISGDYLLSGGELYTTGTCVGSSGHGTFNQSGGVHVAGEYLSLAANPGSTGIYNLSGGYLEPGYGLEVGAGGTFTQTAGYVNTLSNYNTIISVDGAYNLSGGILAPGILLMVNAGGTFNQTGGMVNGIFYQTGLGVSGAYNLSNGSLYCGALALAGDFNYTGGTLSYTSLVFQGGEFWGDLTNQGVLQGSGTIHGNVINAGIVSPGNSPGILTIVGSFTQTAAGTFTVEFASPTSYDQLVVTGAPGTATLAGTLTATPPGCIVCSQRNLVFPAIITATGGVSGKFDSIANQQLNPILFWQPRYNATSVDLLVLPNYANASLPLTANQRQVGVMLNEVNPGATGDLSAVLDNIAQLPTGAAVADAYQQISPDKASALPALSLAGSMMQWQNVANRLSYQRWLKGGMPNLAGGRSGSMNLSYNNLAGLMLAYNGADLTGMTGSRQLKTEGAGTWGLFTDFVSTFGSQKSTLNITGYDFTIFGFTLGADYRLLDDLVIGLGTGYYNTSASYKDSGGSAGINNIPFYAYGAYTPGSFYINGYLGYTLNLYSLDRTIAFGGINRTATSSPNGSQLNGSLETGYDFKVAQFTVTPALSLFYATAWVDSFTEDGAGALNLRVDAQSADSVQTGVGMRLSRPFQSGTTIFLPQIYAFYQHEFANNSRGLDARLAQTGSTFGFQTDSPCRDFAVLGAGLAVGLRQNLTLQANYNTEVGRSGYTPHMVSAGLRYEF